MATLATHYHTGASGPTGSSGMFMPNTVQNTSNNSFTIKPNTNSAKGQVQFTENGEIMIYDGTSWVTVAGIAQETQIDKIKAVLREYYPEVLFDLVMRDLI